MSKERSDPFERAEGDSADLFGKAGRGSDADSLPELPAPPPRESGDEPARAPICLSDLEVEKAKLLLKGPIELAAALLPDVSGPEAQELVGATIDRVAARSRTDSDEGLSIAELAERAGIGQGRIGERFDVHLPVFANVVVRGVQAQGGHRVFYEELSSHAAKAGRRHNGVGTDKVPGGPNSLRMLAYSLGSSDRHCPVASEVLTTGTRWDRANPRYGTAFPRWAADYKGHIPSSFAEHLQVVLESDRLARAALVQALDEESGAFVGRLTPRRMLAAFSPFLVVPPISYGRPDLPYRSHREILLPGRDEATVQLVLSARRHAVLACGEPTIDERLEFEDGSEGLIVGQLPSMYQLDIHKDHSVEYRWSPTRHELGRYEAGRGARLEIWRLVGYDDEESFWRMLSLIERYSQVTWTRGCTRRWEVDCRPGMQKAHMPESCAGVRALLKMANAAIVDALRRKSRPSESK
jgi:hypothetical protein